MSVHVEEKVILQYRQTASELEKLFHTYEKNTHSLQAIQTSMTDFKVKAPIIGSFSAGKSTLINTYLDKRRFLATSISPETAIPTEISYGENEQYVLVTGNGEKRITHDEVKENQFHIQNEKLLKITLPHPVLHETPRVTIVDMPGLDSGIEAHSLAVDAYVANSMAYFIVVDVEYGVKKSIIDFLKELKFFNIPVYVLVTKIDKRKEEIDEVVSDTKQKIAQVLGHQNFKIAAISSSKKQIEPFKEFVRELEINALVIFENQFKQKLLDQVSVLENELQVRLQHDTTTIEDISMEEERIHAEKQRFIQRLEREHEKLVRELQLAVGTIVDGVKNDLTTMADSLVSAAISGIDIQAQVSQAVRQSVIAGIKREIEPKMQRFLQHIGDGVTSSLQINSNMHVSLQDSAIDTMLKSILHDTVTKTITRILPGILGTLGAVLAGPIGGIITALVSVGIEFAFEKKKEMERRKLVEQKIYHELIPSVTSSLHQPISEIVNEHIQLLVTELEKAVGQKEQETMQALQKLREQKELQQQEWEALHVSLQQDLEKVVDLRESLFS